jgi:peptidoglycan/xylan/chitin deacetylase (PgdA/CDA1 family)
MPTIYKYMNPIVVDQARYDVLIARPGYFAVATPDPGDGTNNVGGVAQTDMRLGLKVPVPRAPKVLTHVTSMQSGHGWTASNALANGMNDNTDVALGAQSAYITSKTDTSAATITKTGLSLDLSGSKQLRMLVKVTGGDYITQCLLYYSSDNFVANFGTANIQGPVADPSVRWLKDGEWTWVTVNVGSSSITNNGTVTGTPNLSAISELRVRLVSSSGNSATFRLQAVQVVERKSFASTGIVCFTYDDSYRSQYSIAKVHLDKYGYAGTAYTIDENVRAGDSGNATWMTTAMLKELRKNSRWEISLHADTMNAHSRAMAAATSAQGVQYGTNPLTPTELDNDIDRNLKFLLDNGLTDGYPGHCHPQGRFNTAVNDQLAKRVAYARAMTGNSNGIETCPPANPYAIRSYTLDNTTTYAYLQTVIDAANTHGGMAVFTCHDIVASPSTSTQFSTTIHAQLVDYVATKTGLRVMTLGDVMKSLAAQG